MTALRSVRVIPRIYHKTRLFISNHRARSFPKRRSCLLNLRLSRLCLVVSCRLPLILVLIWIIFEPNSAYWMFLLILRLRYRGMTLMHGLGNIRAVVRISTGIVSITICSFHTLFFICERAICGLLLRRLTRANYVRLLDRLPYRMGRWPLWRLSQGTLVANRSARNLASRAHDLFWYINSVFLASSFKWFAQVFIILGIGLCLLSN